MSILRLTLLLCGYLSCFCHDLAAQTSSAAHAYPPPGSWIATCMIGGNGTRHFLLWPDGTVRTFAAGGKPEPVPGIENAIAIAAGNCHMLALKRDGTVWSWGLNDDFQLGNQALAKSEQNSATPVQVTGITDAVGVSALYNTSFALLADGSIRAWGNGNMGMTGDGKEVTHAMTTSRIAGRPLPVRVQGIKDAVAISGAMALLADGDVMTWGDGHNGRLGNGSEEASGSPVKVSGIKDAIAIAASADSGLALLATGEIWAWGLNYKGQLGNGASHGSQYDHSAVPVRVKGIKNAVAIDAHAANCFALLRDGGVMGWGWGALGALGSRGRDDSSVPVKVPIVKAIAIKAGNGSGFALLGDGSLMGWGTNMVATGSYHQTYSPIKIAMLDLDKSH
ncbi:MAG: hypothetical protein DMG06_09075 [Acidobacteria bacterium]|nr:MAG: hypothetical protein DMG06_09075 [Acidobacteriota bacterium]